MICRHLGKTCGYQVICACLAIEGREFVDEAHRCDLLGVRCLPHFPGPWHAERAMESGLYRLCHGCPHRGV